MAEALREIKNRIRGITSVNKITYAMEMISIAKLNPAKSRLLASRQYFAAIEKLLRDILCSSVSFDHYFLKKRSASGKIGLCLVTSDSGLCASFNHNLNRAAEDFVNQYDKNKIELICIGKKGYNYFKRKGFTVNHAFFELKGRYSPEITQNILKKLTDIYLSGTVDRVYLAYNYFDSNARHRPLIEKILEIEVKNEAKIEFIFEPSANEILEELIPLYLFNRLSFILLNSFTCEHSARVIAMGQATRNAEKLLEELILKRNKVRQANITKEIMEIISSVEVMR